jgi:hypothetical protein
MSAGTLGWGIYRDGREPEELVVRTDLATYAIEAEFVLDSLPATEARWPAMSHADTLGNRRVLDAWRAAVHDEDPASYVHRRPQRSQ